VGVSACTLAVCFADPESMDFSPFLGSCLMASGKSRETGAVPSDDYVGFARGQPPVIGAIERATEPVRLGKKGAMSRPRSVQGDPELRLAPIGVSLNAQALPCIELTNTNTPDVGE
jgi:hypothetical protein